MDLTERVAKALFEADRGGSANWEALCSWADGSPETCEPGSIGRRAPAERFKEAREDRDHWLTLARVAMAEMSK